MKQTNPTCKKELSSGIPCMVHCEECLKQARDDNERRNRVMLLKRGIIKTSKLQ